MDSEVLRNINRKNLPLDQLVRYAKEGAGMGASSRSGTILCLPGDPKEKHFHGYFELDFLVEKWGARGEKQEQTV